jgi:hypothetical protein
MVGPHNSTLVDGELAFDIRQLSPTILAMGGLPVQVQSEGPIKVEILMEGSTEWVTIKSIELKLAPRGTRIGQMQRES